MGAVTGTLINLALYTGLVLAGALLGSRRFLRNRPVVWLGRLQFAALMALIVALGVQLGANEQVIASLGSIGLSALALTVAALAGSMLAVTLLRRFILRLDRRARPKDGTQPEETDGAAAGGKADNALTKWIVAAVAAGMLAGRFLLPSTVSALAGNVVDIGLYLLLFLVGIDMGRKGNILSSVRAAGVGVLLTPLCTALGTVGAAALTALILPYSVKECVAAACGFGWYSLGPTLIAPYSLTVSAVAFLSNVMRELFSILLIPLVAKRVGWLECAALPGAAAMDTVLPVVVRATAERMTVYSFVPGVLLSLAVPVLVPFIISL